MRKFQWLIEKKSHKTHINQVTTFEGVQKLYKDWTCTGKYPWLNGREGGVSGLLSQVQDHFPPYRHSPARCRFQERRWGAPCWLAVQTFQVSPALLKASESYHSLCYFSLCLSGKRNKFYENLWANTVIWKTRSGLDFPFNCRSVVSLSIFHLSLTLSNSCFESKTHHKSFVKLLWQSPAFATKHVTVTLFFSRSLLKFRNPDMLMKTPNWMITSKRPGRLPATHVFYNTALLPAYMNQYVQWRVINKVKSKGVGGGKSTPQLRKPVPIAGTVPRWYETASLRSPVMLVYS